jgi:hypothetical protein
MDVGPQRRFEGDRLDRAPAGAIGDTGLRRDGAGPLRRDHIGDGRPVGAELCGEGERRGIDRGHLAALAERHPFDHAGIEFGPAVLEQALLGKGILRVEQQQLRLRLPDREPVGDQAGALVGAGRAAEGIGGRRHHDQPAIVHRLQLPAQQHGLRPRLPGMRHLLRCGLVVARDRAPVEVDAGRHDQPVVGKPVAVGQGHRPRVDINRGRARLGDRNPGALDSVVAELLLVDLAQVRQHRIAEGAGCVDGVRLDQGDVERGLQPLQGARHRGPTEAATDHDDPGPPLCRNHGRGEPGRGGEFQEVTARRHACFIPTPAARRTRPRSPRSADRRIPWRCGPSRSRARRRCDTRA